MGVPCGRRGHLRRAVAAAFCSMSRADVRTLVCKARHTETQGWAVAVDRVHLVHAPDGAVPTKPGFGLPLRPPNSAGRRWRFQHPEQLHSLCRPTS